MKELWGREQEINFFTEARGFAAPEQLFYLSDDDRYYAYWPKSYKGSKSTLQARNALIGKYTEKWSADLLSEFAQSKGYYAVQGVVCDEIGLPRISSADVAICKTKNISQRAEDILLIIEVKMSVGWNWELKYEGGKEEPVCLGDYTTHQGNPGLLRSDTMLKAIGKSINVRVSSPKASKIPSSVFPAITFSSFINPWLNFILIPFEIASCASHILYSAEPVRINFIIPKLSFEAR